MPRALTERAPGFGVVEFDKSARKITLTNWPRWADLSSGAPKPYPGWPVSIEQLDNGLSASGWELRLPEKVSGLIEVFAAAAKTEPVLSWRPPQPLQAIPIWEEGAYEVRVGKRVWKTEAVKRG